MNRDIIIFILFIAYFILYFFSTQKLILSKKLFYLTFLALVTNCLIISFQPNEKLIYVFVTLFSCHIYYLVFIKLIYVKLNHFLINRNLLDKKYQLKKLTFVVVGKTGLSKYDETMSPPSWLDYLLSVSIIIIPLFVSCLLLK